MTTTERPERSVPKPVFTDAEAGAREFPDSGAGRPPVQLLHPGQAQADPLRGRHGRRPARPAALPLPGLDLRLRQRRDRLPLHWTKLKAWGVDQPEPKRGTGQRRDAGPELARPRVARVPRPERGVGADPLPLQRERRPAAEPERRERAQRQGVRLVGHQLGAVRRAARRRVDAHRAHSRALRLRLQRALLSDEHAQHRAGRQQRPQDPVRAGPGAVQPHAERGDRGLRRRARTSRRGTPTPSGRAPASSPRR